MTISYTQVAFKGLGVALKLLGYWDIGILTGAWKQFSFSHYALVVREINFLGLHSRVAA